MIYLLCLLNIMLIAKPEIQTHKPSTHRFSTRRKAELIACAFVGLAVVSGGIYIVTKQSAIYTQAQLDQIRAEIQDINAYKIHLQSQAVSKNWQIQIITTPFRNGYPHLNIMQEEKVLLHMPLKAALTLNNLLFIDFLDVIFDPKIKTLSDQLKALSERCAIYTNLTDVKLYRSIAYILYIISTQTKQDDHVNYNDIVKNTEHLKAFQDMIHLSEVLRFLNTIDH